MSRRLFLPLLLSGIVMGGLGLQIQFDLGLTCRPYCSLQSGPWLAVGLLLFSAGSVIAPGGLILRGMAQKSLEDAVLDWSVAALICLVFCMAFLYAHTTAA